MFTLQVFNRIDGHLVTTIIGFNSTDEAIEFYNMYYDIEFDCTISEQEECHYV